MAEEPKENEQPEGTEAPKPAPSKEPSSIWETLEPIVTIAGTWAWVIAALNGLISIIMIFVTLSPWLPLLTNPLYAQFIPWATIVWYIIVAIVEVLFAIAILRPRFSNKCKEQDWDYLLNDVLVLGNFRFPWMFVWAIILTIFSWSYWGGAAVWFCAFVIIFMGPKPYQWTE
ncbi:MAG: hypothetical protein GF311_12430 [Candidatus Lokiarchaeota archaeon]|nr:hypothetical protein [Candidatus Lokiarchaeota archaeon]